MAVGGGARVTCPFGSGYRPPEKDLLFPSHNFLLLSSPVDTYSWQNFPMEQQGHQDSQDREGESSNPSSSTPSEGSRFTFVLDRNQAGTRNHAMRAHWAERHKARRENKRKHESRKQLPRIAAKERSASQNSGSSSGQQDNIAEPSTAPSRVSPVAEQSPYSQMAMMGGFQGGMPGVPGQILMGLNHSLASTRLDPFDTFPIKLNVQHHKLIHHCNVYHMCHADCNLRV